MPLFRPGTTSSPYGFSNAEEILNANVFLAISGHWHEGCIHLEENGFSSVTAPALCEKTMPYLILELNDSRISAEQETLALPDGFFDSHTHTKFAYCQENMNPERVLELVKAFNLSRFAITEHSGQLYCSAPDYWQGTLQRQGLAGTERICRVPEYLDLLDELGGKADFVRGFEVDVAQDGSLLVLPGDLAKVSLRVGAVHWLSATDREEQKKEFLFRTEALLSRGCQILAHPFRVFSWHNPPVPTELYTPVIALLKKYGAAAEINFHHNLPSDEFCRMCLENGIKLATGSDSHNLYELGEFYAQIKLMKRLGISQRDMFAF